MGLRLLLIGIVLAGLAYTGLWFQMADGARERLDATVAAAEQRGIAIDFASAETHGFPDRIALRLEDLGLDGGPAPLHLRSARLTLAARAWAPDHLLGEGQELRLTLGDWRLAAPTSRMSWHRRSKSRDLDIEFGSVRLFPRGQGATERRAKGLELHIRLPRRDGTGESDLLAPRRARIAVASRGLVAGEGMAPIERLSGEGVLRGAIAYPFDRAALAAWRDDGGTLEIESLELAWGDLTATGSGSLSLDDAFRPIGAVTITVNDPAALLDKLAESGLVEAGLARRVRPALTALGRSRGGEPIELPLTLQEGRLLLSGIAIARIEPVIAG